MTGSQQNAGRLPLRSLLARFFIIFAAFGAVLPLGIVAYEHRVKWLPINLVMALWPSSTVLLPMPSGPSAIFLNAISLALNAVIYGIAGALIALIVNALRAQSE